MVMRENVIESYFCQEIKKLGGWPIKLTSAALRALPDRLCLLPGGLVAFVELKAPGRKPTVKQVYIMKKLKAMGFTCAVIDSRPRVDAFIDIYRRRIFEAKLNRG